MNRQLDAEATEKSKRTEIIEQHEQKLKALDMQREAEEKAKEAKRLEQQEKARQKSSELEKLKQSWATVYPTSEKKKVKNKNRQASAEDNDPTDPVDYPPGGGVDMYDSDNIPSEQEVDFGSDSSSVSSRDGHTDSPGKKRNFDHANDSKLHKKTVKSKKLKRPREEGEGVSGGRLKKRSVMSDEDVGVFEDDSLVKAQLGDTGDLFDSDDEVNAYKGSSDKLLENELTAKNPKISRVIDDDEEDEEWNE